jgi:transcriptional regulator with PAS, ATPase and Fis domain
MPLEQLVAQGRMRADFFYRLNVLRLDVPALRERVDDIELLARQFLAEDPLARRSGIDAIPAAVMAELRTHRWPGNVRELRNVLGRAVALASLGGALTVDLGASPVVDAPCLRPPGDAPPPFRTWMRARERDYLSELVRRYRTTSEQAIASGLPHRTLYRKLRSHRLSGSRAGGAGADSAPRTPDGVLDDGWAAATWSASSAEGDAGGRGDERS